MNARTPIAWRKVDSIAMMWSCAAAGAGTGAGAGADAAAGAGAGAAAKSIVTNPPMGSTGSAIVFVLCF